MEFYDLMSDPEEQLNLINAQAYQEVIGELKTGLDEWMKDQGDEGRPHLRPYPASGPRPDESFLKN